MMRKPEWAEHVKVGVWLKSSIYIKTSSNQVFSTMCNFISDRKETAGARWKPGVR